MLGYRVVVGTQPTKLDAERLSPVRHRRFTVAEYHQMIEVGILSEDEHVEMLEGEIVEMSPQGKAHARAIRKLTRWFNQGLGEDYAVRTRLPLTLLDSEPEPDLAIVRADAEAAAERHPTEALLVVEVAESSPRVDLEVKARIYAKAGIPECWLALVRRHAIDVLRDPQPDTETYRTRFTASADSAVTPAAFPGPVIRVESVFD